MKCWKIGFAFVAATMIVAAIRGEARADGIPLGITIQETPKGILVTDVQPSGIADRCMPRLRPGAYLMTLNGLPIKSAADFKRVLETNAFVKFEFVDPAGNFRWARAWSGGYTCQCDKP